MSPLKSAHVITNAYPHLVEKKNLLLDEATIYQTWSYYFCLVLSNTALYSDNYAQNIWLATKKS